MATPLNTLMSRMASLDHQSIDKDAMACLYGGPGAGKTTTAMGLAQRLKGNGSILLLDSAEGYVSMEAFPSLMADVQIVPNTTAKELAAVAEALTKRSKGFENTTVIVVDELSSMAQDVLENVVRDRAAVTIGDILPEIEGKDYGPMTQIVSALLRRLQKVENLHVIIIAHDREKEDKRRGLLVSPQFPPLLLKEMQKLMHVTANQVARIDAQGRYTYQLQSRPTVSVQAKSRIPNTPVLMDPSDWIDFVAQWVLSEEMVEDLNLPETPEIPADIALPVDGSALDPETDQGDDEPAFVGEPS